MGQQRETSRGTEARFLRLYTGFIPYHELPVSICGCSNRALQIDQSI